MSYEFYKWLHLIGLFVLTIGVSGMIILKAFSDPKPGLKKISAIFHGLGLVASLVGGFGLLARIGGQFEGWVIAKVGYWLALGLVPLGTKFLPVPSVIGATLAIIVAAVTTVIFRSTLG